MRALLSPGVALLAAAPAPFAASAADEARQKLNILQTELKVMKPRMSLPPALPNDAVLEGSAEEQAAPRRPRGRRGAPSVNQGRRLAAPSPEMNAVRAAMYFFGPVRRFF